MGEKRISAPARTVADTERIFTNAYLWELIFQERKRFDHLKRCLGVQKNFDGLTLMINPHLGQNFDAITVSAYHINAERHGSPEPSDGIGSIDRGMHGSLGYFPR